MLTPIVPVDCCASAASARSGGRGRECHCVSSGCILVLKAYCFQDLFQVQTSCWLLRPELPAAVVATVCMNRSEKSVCKRASLWSAYVHTHLLVICGCSQCSQPECSSTQPNIVDTSKTHHSLLQSSCILLPVGVCNFDY